MTDELVRSLVGDLTPVRRLRSATWRAGLWIGLAVASVATGTSVWGARPDLGQKLCDPAYVIEGAALVTVFLLSAWSAFALSVPGGGRTSVTRWSPILGLLAWALLVAVRDPFAASATHAGWTCVGRMIVLAFVPASAALVMLRKAAPLRPGWGGALAVLSASALAMLGTQVVCAKDEPRHLLVWHVGPVALAGLVGVVLGRRWLPSWGSGCARAASCSPRRSG